MKTHIAEINNLNSNFFVHFSGPQPLPMIGNSLVIDHQNLRKSLTKLREAYGAVVGLVFPGIKVIVISECEAVIKGLMKSEFSGRHDVPLVAERFDDGENHGKLKMKSLCISYSYQILQDTSRTLKVSSLAVLVLDWFRSKT